MSTTDPTVTSLSLRKFDPGSPAVDEIVRSASYTSGVAKLMIVRPYTRPVSNITVTMCPVGGSGSWACGNDGGTIKNFTQSRVGNRVRITGVWSESGSLYEMVVLFSEEISKHVP